MNTVLTRVIFGGGVRGSAGELQASRQPHHVCQSKQQMVMELSYVHVTSLSAHFQAVSGVTAGPAFLLHAAVACSCARVVLTACPASFSAGMPRMALLLSAAY
jgi:hypothetical protein